MGDDKVVRLKWQHSCLKNSQGKLLSNVANALIGLRRDANLAGMFGYDELQRLPMVLRELGVLSGEMEPRPLSDDDVTRVQSYLQDAGLGALGSDATHRAVNLVCSERAYNPLLDTLDGLVWDEVQRINVWLASCLGAELNQYTQHIGRMFLIQMVARAYEPGCRADHMLILQGEQGVLKSTACRVLGEPWYTDNLPDLSLSKECSQHLRGQWLIEVPELNAMKRSDQALLKSFMTRTHERYRPSYGRHEVVEPRTCSLIGTVNEEFFLHDPTGGRRFWPVRVGVTADIKIEYLREIREQLFAEAVHWYRHGVQWWPDAQFQIEMITPEQEERFEADVWEPAIERFLAGKTSTTIELILTHESVIGMQLKDQAQLDGKRVGAILRRLRWIPKRSKNRRWWEPMT